MTLKLRAEALSVAMKAFLLIHPKHLQSTMLSLDALCKNSPRSRGSNLFKSALPLPQYVKFPMVRKPLMSRYIDQSKYITRIWLRKCLHLINTLYFCKEHRTVIDIIGILKQFYTCCKNRSLLLLLCSLYKHQSYFHAWLITKRKHFLNNKRETAMFILGNLNMFQSQNMFATTTKSNKT